MVKKRIERKTDVEFDAIVRDHSIITIKDSTMKRLNINTGDIVAVKIVAVSSITNKQKRQDNEKPETKK